MDNIKAIKFTVPGEPVGKGRPKFDTRGPYVRAVTPKKTANYETLVRMEYEAQCGGQFFPKEIALGMEIIIHKAPPASTSERKKREMLFGGIIFPGKKPDWDNVGKIVCDALNGVAFHDDAQVVKASVEKVYSEKPYLTVTIWKVGENG